MIRLIPKIAVIASCWFFTPVAVQAQVALQWQKCYGGLGDDIGYSIDKAHGGGYVIAGSRDTCQKGKTDFWVVKTDDTGYMVWAKCYGGSAGEIAYDIQRVTGAAPNDSGYIVVGQTNSSDGDVTGYHGVGDIWVIRIDMNGNLQWQKTLGGSQLDIGRSVRQTPDGGYVVVGSTASNDGDVTGNHGSDDIWVVKLNKTGSIEWQKALGGSTTEYGFAVDATHDGGVIVAGQTASTDGDVSSLIGMFDYWVIKLNSTGNLQWEKTYGGFGSDWAFSIAQTTDSGFIIGGVSTYAPTPNVFHSIIKTDKTGAVQWTAEPSYTTCIRQTTGGGYIAINSTLAVDGFHILKLDSAGKLMWEKDWGGSGHEDPRTVLESDDGGYVIAGQTTSNDGDVSGNHGKIDYWIVKTTADITSVPNIQSGKADISFYPNPATEMIHFSRSVNVRVLNLLGQVVKEQRNTKTVDLSQCRQGPHFLVFYDSKGQVIQTAKVIKQ